jgi:tetratricopeptide (TPR) repeat protein
VAGPPPAEDRARRLLEDAFRLSEAGQLQQAIRACQQAISLNPASTSAHSLLGTLFERAGDRDGAIREYEQVLTLSPGSTAERRRLNELMGVPAAPEAVAVSPRTARLAVTGGFLVVALVLAGAIVFTTQQGEPPPRQGRARPPARVAQQQAEAGAAAQSMAAPSRVINLGRTMLGRPTVPRQVAARPRETSRRREYGFGQWVAPGAFLLTSGGGGGYQRPPAGARPRWQAAAPMQGAVLMAGTRAPAIRTPGGRYGSGLSQAGWGSSPRVAQAYYAQGQYQRAIEAYRGYLRQNPNAGGAPREELAWVYMESGDYGNAGREYRTALGQYRDDLSRGHNVEAAKHGARTCESAVRALESN